MTEAPTMEEAYRLYRSRTLKLCMKMLKDADEAEDAMQDVFVHLHRKIGDFRGESRFSTWLHSMTVNLVLMKLRQRSFQFRRGLVSLEGMEDEAANHGTGRLETALRVEDVGLRSAVDRLALKKAMAAMPAGYRVAVELEMQGFNSMEAAAMLECSVGNHKSQLRRAKRWLADALDAVSAKADTASVGEPDALTALLESFGQYE